jgi:tellurite methyltransferase
MATADRDKWNAKYQNDIAPSEPSAVLTGLAEFLPAHGSALDLAGGAGRNAIWLARRGLNVTIADISSAGLRLASQRARDLGLEIKAREIDLEQEPLQDEQFDLVLSVCFSVRQLYTPIARLLNPGGTLVVIQPTVKNLERNAKPAREYLLNEGELPALVRGLDVVHYEEGWLAEGRHDAVIVARKGLAGVV